MKARAPEIRGVVAGEYSCACIGRAARTRRPLIPVPATAAIPVVIGVACIVGVGLYYRHVRSKKRGKFLLRETGSPPVLKRASGVKYDLFISHCWASAQDQAAPARRGPRTSRRPWLCAHGRSYALAC